jgi:uncharacterized radical SAM superfamily Fe-S cluster-containing enzyme
MMIFIAFSCNKKVANTSNVEETKESIIEPIPEKVELKELDKFALNIIRRVESHMSLTDDQKNQIGELCASVKLTSDEKVDKRNIKKDIITQIYNNYLTDSQKAKVSLQQLLSARSK